MNLLNQFRRFFRSHGNATAGAAAVELAIIAPIVVMALICTVDLGFGVYRNMQVELAAQAGAEYAVARGFSTTAIANAITTATSFSRIAANPVPTKFCGCPTASGVSVAPCGQPCSSNGPNAGVYVTTAAQATYIPMLPYPLLPNTYNFTAQSTVRIQ